MTDGEIASFLHHMTSKKEMIYVLNFWETSWAYRIKHRYLYVEDRTLWGSALWQNCHKKILILGITPNFHIQLNFRDSWSCVMLSWALQVADLVVKSPLSVKLQQKESSIFLNGIGTAKTSLTKCYGKNWDNLTESHEFSGVINSFTLTWDLSRTEGLGSRSSTKGDSWHQLSIQKEIGVPIA